MAIAAKRGHVEAIAALAEPPVPKGFRYLVEWFFELHPCRGSGPHGPAGFTWPDFDAWARRTSREPSPWEFGVLKAMDEAFFRATAPAPVKAK